MTIASTPASSFDVLTGPMTDELLAEAAAIATVAVNDPAEGVVVVVVRPDDDHQVIAGGGTGILRAAVSVAAAAGNDRAWRDAPDADTVERPIRALPEVIAAAADADGVRSVHVGCIRVDGVVESVALWFETWDGVAPAERRREHLARLAQAGERERTRRAAIAASAPSTVGTDGADASGASGPREFDPTDPTLDPLTGLVCDEHWSELLEDFDRDEAMLVLLDLDGFSTVTEEWGDDVADRILREIADRLVMNCRRTDTIARLGPDRFAVLFGTIERAEVIEVAKRLLAAVADPLPEGLGPERVTATVALAHQVGLVDLEEMLDSATDALTSGKRSGAGRVVLAA